MAVVVFLLLIATTFCERHQNDEEAVTFPVNAGRSGLDTTAGYRRAHLSTVESRDHAQGSSTALVTLIEYGDYECSYCGEAYAIVQAVQRTMGARMRFVFRNFPLLDLHPNALGAAHAAEAAALQGQFWPMHDALYEHQAQLEAAALIGYAEALGLDGETFRRDAGSDAIAARIQDDIDSGTQAAVRGTPTFYINGALHAGDWREPALLAALQAATLTTHVVT